MVATIRIGFPAIGGKYQSAAASVIEAVVKVIASLPRKERPQLYAVVTEESFTEFNLQPLQTSVFDGIIFIGENSKKAEAIMGLSLIPTTDDQLFDNIDFFLTAADLDILPNKCTAVWVSDFQHRHGSELFLPQECAWRDNQIQKIADIAKLVLFTSSSANQDFLTIHPSAKTATKTLAIPVYPDEEWYTTDPYEVQAKYRLPDRFVLCANAFQAHKAHDRLFKAIALLRRTGQDVHLVCTGSTDDPRWPSYLQQLRQYIKMLGITDLVDMLGSVPHLDEIQLLRRSLFVIQPSLCEGLSTIIPQCRALGKPIILSDLDIHVEQGYGNFFQKTNEEDLAQKISELLTISQTGPDLLQERKAKKQNAKLRNLFMQEICDIVREFSPVAITEAITIATSLAPRELGNQRKAINSWQKLGFKVVSLNAPEEIAALQPHFADVEFVAIERHGDGKYGKPYVYFDDFLAYFEKQDAPICGIVNSDIHLLKENFHSIMLQEAKDSLVYGSRVDVDSLDTLQGHMYNYGFDYFFFDKKIIPYYPKEEFCIGLPWWDYWAPLVPQGYKITVKKLITPVAYHVKHPLNYNVKNLISFGYIFAKYFPPPFSLSEVSMPQFARFVRKMIQQHSIEIAI